MRYSRRALIKILRTKARQLGRTPRLVEWGRVGGRPSGPIYSRIFGSWNGALKAAGLPINRTARFDTRQIIEIIRRRARELDRLPTLQDFAGNPRMPSPGTVSQRFSSFSAALRAAGLRPRRTRWTDRELLEGLKRKARRLGRPPTTGEIRADRSMASPRTYLKRFGSMREARSRAGLAPGHPSTYSEKELIESLRRIARRLRRAPSCPEVNREPGMPGASTYAYRWGSWERALAAAGIRPYDRTRTRRRRTQSSRRPSRR